MARLHALKNIGLFFTGSDEMWPSPNTSVGSHVSGPSLNLSRGVSVEGSFMFFQTYSEACSSTRSCDEEVDKKNSRHAFRLGWGRGAGVIQKELQTNQSTKSINQTKSKADSTPKC